LAAIKKYAAAQNIKVVAVFEEKGVPGATELDNRPALVRMLEALAADGVRLVLIEKLDRLARDLMVQESIIGDLHKRGFKLISAHEPDLLQDDPSRKLMRQIFGAIAEYDKAMIVAKLRGARERMRQREGYCEGRKPYGTRDGEQEVVNLMVDLRQHGATLDDIANRLNKDGVATRVDGGKWYNTTVRRILAVAGVDKPRRSHE
jgi:DNA invertase Pin-like site-specific DNA recombinase